MKRKILTILLATLFLGVMFGGLFHMSSGMNMEGGMSDCPFMSSNETLCKMSIFDHLASWQSYFLAVIPVFVSLLSVLIVTATFLAVAPNLIFSRKKIPDKNFSLNVSNKTLTFSRHPLQELFSNGILHPKLF